MIKELKILLEKYQVIQKKSEYIAIEEIVNDLYYLIQDCRLKRIPKEER